MRGGGGDKGCEMSQGNFAQNASTGLMITFSLRAGSWWFNDWVFTHARLLVLLQVLATCWRSVASELRLGVRVLIVCLVCVVRLLFLTHALSPPRRVRQISPPPCLPVKLRPSPSRTGLNALLQRFRLN